MRSQTHYVPNCHGLAREGLIERFGETHPAYFALLQNGNRDNSRALPGHRGHLCFTNPGLADEIYQDVRVEVPHISLGTVYRNLSLLADGGLLRQLGNGAGPCRFDGDLTAHYHIRCGACDRLDDACIEPATFLEESVRRVSDYTIDGHWIEFMGRCPACQD